MVTVAVVAVLQLVIVGLAVAPRLSAYARGEDYLLRVAPIDPVDPFRGAYVDLTYPDLQPRRRHQADLPDGTTYVRLVSRTASSVHKAVLQVRASQGAGATLYLLVQQATATPRGACLGCGVVCRTCCAGH